ncbi:unnamed protein product [Cuscuta campestris]|uniref:Uncharacterized protein n=1 Tax=Cuscuta campestris TaxID=132261 RepID=A0A484KF09_9ASTE|nr:unnamed protein product [Cuscuta campestris]
MAAKGGGGHGGGGGAGGSRAGRSYAMVLMVAFGAAIVGVMILYKFRERRIFNLVLRDKDTQLLSLHLLLQKEKENAKDAKRQMDDLKAKMHKLRGKKADLEARIMEMESTISSLREEQKTISSSLKEKKKEIKVLMDYKRGQNRETARLMALSQELQKKAAEIEELRLRVDLPPPAVKVWSVSSDDPSSLPANFTTKAARQEEEVRKENGRGKSAEISSQMHSQNETAESQQVSENGGTTLVGGGGDQSRNGVEYESTGRRVRRMGRRRRINDGNRDAASSSDTALKSENGVESVRSGKSLPESERKRGSNELGLDETNGEMYGREKNGRSNVQKKLPANSRAVDDSKLLNKPEN